MNGRSNSTEPSGLEQMQAFAEAGGALASICLAIAMRPMEVTRGQVVLEAKSDARHLNPMGGCMEAVRAPGSRGLTGTARWTWP